MLLLHNQQLFQVKIKSLKEKKNINAEKNNVEKISVNLNNNSINNINNEINHKTEDFVVQIVNKRNILITLPLDVTRHFISIWLDIKNVCYLDSAFCNKKQRTIFLDILNGSE
jgi:predicted metalloenzyme YecM